MNHWTACPSRWEFETRHGRKAVVFLDPRRPPVLAQMPRPLDAAEARRFKANVIARAIVEAARAQMRPIAFVDPPRFITYRQVSSVPDGDCAVAT